MSPRAALSPLPIDARLPDILAGLKQRGAAVVVAEPGAGKTTRLPSALLDTSLPGEGRVLVLEPRRIAARMAARRVAEERGCRPGAEVGHAVRFERKYGEDTRLIFLTEALLVRWMLRSPGLQGIAAVVLDEFHERSVHTDLALALLCRLRETERPDLRLVVMSATLDAAPVAAFMNADVHEVSGRSYPVQIDHLPAPDDRPLEQRVAAALRRLCMEGLDGDVLVFLPGAAEIRRVRERCEITARDFDLALVPLHGDLPAADQDRAVRVGTGRRVILSTNIAESSLTLPGVAAVIDSGLVRRAGHSPWSGLATLQTATISQASAVQRAGRAGRVRAGRCLRLYTRADFVARPAADIPELQRSELAELALLAHGLLGEHMKGLRWFEPPPRVAWDAARDLLERLGALRDGTPTKHGQLLLRLAVHPRAATLAASAARQGFAEEGAMMAALLGERDPRLDQRTFSAAGAARDDDMGNSDLIARLEAIEQLSGSVDGAALRRYGLDGRVVRSVTRVARSLRRDLPPAIEQAPSERETALLRATLAAFPDRVARRRHEGGRELNFCQGGGGSLEPSSVVKDADLMVAVEAEQRGRGAVRVRAASRVEEDWLLELFEQRLQLQDRVDFDHERQRVRCWRELRYEQLVIDQSESDAEGAAVSTVLAREALAAGHNAPWDVQAIERLQRRLSFAHGFDPTLPRLDSAGLETLVQNHCEGKRGFDELRADPLEGVVEHLLDGPSQRALREIAPVETTLPSGRKLKIHYEPDAPPWVRSRLQDFFGMVEGPRIANGRCALVLHLLAPNQRAVQVSTDLAGFWDRHYPELRKQLKRRYPRHSWPEDPATAVPPEPRGRPSRSR